ncbi:MAG TPA: A/G-specific adenine glycosylase [Chloroflexota bacterium]|nr:A/G-specific adenine glycosylase [Chloroflexota bacterium]
MNQPDHQGVNALSPTRIGDFRRHVLSWFRQHGRDLPWRHTRDPYRIMVSEVMLQQTQVSRVAPAYHSFLQLFPEVGALAVAPFRSVLESWRGLGYNRRALYLHQAAMAIQFDRGSAFPQTVEELRRLPGVGAYTASAIACFAFDAQVAVVETNVRSAIQWLVDPTFSATLREAEVQDIAARLLPPGQAWEWNQAMIDFGALSVRKPRRARISGSENFRQSNRYWRGQILRAVSATTAPVSMCRLLRELPEDREEYRVRELVSTLAEEGFLTVDLLRQRIAVPGD